MPTIAGVPAGGGGEGAFVTAGGERRYERSQGSDHTSGAPRDDLGVAEFRSGMRKSLRQGVLGSEQTMLRRGRGS